ncbi:nicotinate-nucleotide adenylyltransferase [Paraglaciecola aestuariivivens]
MTKTMQLAPALGIFGGTFDPIHFGHIQPILEAATLTHIKKIALLPCFIPSHKSAASASSQHRFKMLELVCQHHPIFYPDPRDIKRNIPTVSIDSLKELRAEHPRSPLCFFIGTDSLYTLTSWYQWEALFDYCHFIVCHRKGQAVDALSQDPQRQTQLQKLLKDKQTLDPQDLHTRLNGHIYLADTQPLTLSSSAIRQQLGTHSLEANLLPSEVLTYIQQHKLYQP